MAAGRILSCLPVSSPTIPSPVNCCHQEWVCLSYIIRPLFLRFPETPKSYTTPSSLLSKTKAELHKGQKVTATGTPATTSLTISCQSSMGTGYALASPFSSRAMTKWKLLGQSTASSTGVKAGESMAGITESREPDARRISVSGTLCLVKSVLQPASKNRTPLNVVLRSS